MTVVGAPAKRTAAGARASRDGVRRRLLSMAEVGDRLTELRNSARGWHGVQLAVLGFIGLCGVLQSGAADDNP